MKKVTAFAVLLVVLAAPAWAGWNEGVLAYFRGDYATAFREMKPLAEQGHASAQYNLGIMYEKGQGVPQDYAEAVKLFRKAAEQGPRRCPVQSRSHIQQWPGRAARIC